MARTGIKTIGIALMVATLLAAHSISAADDEAGHKSLVRQGDREWDHTVVRATTRGRPASVPPQSGT